MTTKLGVGPATSIRADIDVEAIIRLFGGPGDLADAFLELEMIVRPATIGKWRSTRSLPIWAWFSILHLQKMGVAQGAPIDASYVKGVVYRRKNKEIYVSLDGKPRRTKAA